MTRQAAIHQFFNGFMTAYAETEVPETAQLPYLTYEMQTGYFGEQVPITVNLWFYTTSEATPNAKAEEFGNLIGYGGIMLPYDGGAVWLRRGEPFCQSIRDDTDTKIKRRYINLTAEFMNE